MVQADRRDIVGTAARVRSLAGIDEPAYSTRQIVEACFPTALVTGTKRLPHGITEAVSLTADGPVILYERRLSVPRQRFVIAHALAHLLFDLDDTGALCTVGSRGCEDAESRADAFAAELLVPLSELASYVGTHPANDSHDDIYMDQVDEIASHFNVTQALIDARIREMLR